MRARWQVQLVICRSHQPHASLYAVRGRTTSYALVGSPLYSDISVTQGAVQMMSSGIGQFDGTVQQVGCHWSHVTLRAPSGF